MILDRWRKTQNSNGLRCKWHLTRISIVIACGISAFGWAGELQRIDSCGASLPLKINYISSGPRSSIPPRYPSPTTELLAVFGSAQGSTILIRMERPTNDATIVQYLSDDRGQTWRSCDWDLGFTNLANWSVTEKLMSRVDHRVLYDCYGVFGGSFRLSKDGGKTWDLITPMIGGRGINNLGKIEFIETGALAPGRLYARIWPGDGDETKICVSDDYGKSFKYLTDQVDRVVEARADDKILFGGLPSVQRIGVSRNGGISWKALEASSEFWLPLYHDALTGFIHTWRKSPQDQKYIPIFQIQQIEGDPKDTNLVYILSYKGLYISRDGGLSYRLAHLAEGRLNAIDRIAVDPQDGRFIYATVDMGKFYCSSDYGCSWKELKLPEIPRHLTR